MSQTKTAPPAVPPAAPPAPAVSDPSPAAAPASVVLAEDLFGVADGRVHPEWHKAGATVTGELASAAVELGKAPDPRTGKLAPANKSAPGAPETKG